LLDSQGRLVGINTSIFSPGGTPGNIGIGFAIPVDTIRRVINQLMLHGKVVRPTLGISIVDDRVARNIEKQLRLPLDGCLVGEVYQNSPAMLSGLEAFAQDMDGSILLGDLVTHINGEAVREAEDLLSAVEERTEGETVSLRILRQCDPGKAEIVPVVLTNQDRLQRPTTRHSHQEPHHEPPPMYHNMQQPPAHHMQQPPAHHMQQPPAHHIQQPPAHHMQQPPAHHMQQPPAHSDFGHPHGGAPHHPHMPPPGMHPEPGMWDFAPPPPPHHMGQHHMEPPMQPFTHWQ
jgi:hypothetical protein